MPTDMPFQAQDLLAAQAKAIARYQGPEAGIDPRSMRSKLDGERWQRLQRGVYATFSGDPAPHEKPCSGRHCFAPGQVLF
jgi:hypothetical protein